MLFNNSIKFQVGSGKDAKEHKASVFFQMTKEGVDFKTENYKEITNVNGKQVERIIKKRVFNGHNDLVLLKLDHHSDNYFKKTSVVNPTSLFNGVNEELISKATEKFDTIFNFVPDDFTRYTKQMEVMNTSDLKAFLKNEQERGLDSGKKYSIELYRRTADPFTIFILTLIGVSVASRKVRGGMGFHLAAGIVIGAIFVILSKFSTTFSTNLSLHPGIGVWIPNMLFSLVAIYLVKTAQK